MATSSISGYAPRTRAAYRPAPTATKTSGGTKPAQVSETAKADPKQTSRPEAPAPDVKAEPTYTRPGNVPADATTRRGDLELAGNMRAAALEKTLDSQKPASKWGPTYQQVANGTSAFHKDQRGEGVKQMQQRLKAAGYKVPTNGRYDDATFAAVQDYKKKNKLPLNGIVDQKTLQGIERQAVDKSLKVDAKTKEDTLRRLDAADPKTRTQMSALASSPRFAAMSAEDQKKSLNVFDKTTPAGRDAFLELVDKDVDGKPALESKDKNGATLLDSLDRLASSPLDSRITDASGKPQDKARVTEDVMQELARPAQQLNQDNRGTCTVTSMSSTLATKQPAEYARIVTDLATKGEAKVANGDTIKPPTDGFAQDNSNRSVSERLLQSSLMDYARPGERYENWNPGPDGVRGTDDDGFADPTNPTSRALDGYPPTGGGLVPEDNIRVMNALYGKPHEQHTDDLLNRTRGAIDAGKGPVFTGVNWGSGAHALEVQKVENGRVYYRNPWGPDAVGQNGVTYGTAANDTDAGPRRRVEDHDNGVESMTIEDYQRYARDIIVEK